MDNTNPIPDPYKDPRLQRGLAAIARDMEAKRNKTKSYYNEDAANEVKALLDKLWSGEMTYIRIQTTIASTANTLRMRYYQGAQYLREKADPTGHYEKLIARTKCATYKHYIELVKKTRIATPLISFADWKSAFEEFIENAEPGQKFVRQDIVLNDDDIEWLNAQMAPISDLYLYKFSRQEILVIRYDK